MKTTLHTDVTVFETLGDEWDRIVSLQGSKSFFSLVDWQRIWWKNLGHGELLVITFHDEDDQLRGIASCFIDGDRTLHFVGCADVSDYLDLIIDPDFEDEVLRAFASYLTSEGAPAWDTVDLCNIPDDSATLKLLPDIFKELGLSVTQEQIEVCPVVMLPADYEVYLGELKKKQRHELRRKRRRAEGLPTNWYRVDESHDLLVEIETFLNLMVASSPNKAEFLEQPGHRPFFVEVGQAMFKKGHLSLITLTVEDQPIASMWQFEYKERLLLYNSGQIIEGFSAISPGIVLLTYSIEESIKQGLSSYDFLRGDETYKYRMGASDTVVYNLKVVR